MATQPTAVRARWAAYLRAQLDQRNLTQAEFVRLLDRPTNGDKSVVSRWLQATLGVSPEMAIRVAQVFDLPATQVLREAGHDDLAAYIEDVAGTRADDIAALEPLVARVRKVTEGLTDGERAALEQELLDQIGNSFLLAETKAARLRRVTEEERRRGAS